MYSSSGCIAVCQNIGFKWFGSNRFHKYVTKFIIMTCFGANSLQGESFVVLFFCELLGGSMFPAPQSSMVYHNFRTYLHLKIAWRLSALARRLPGIICRAITNINFIRHTRHQSRSSSWNICDWPAHWVTTWTMFTYWRTLRYIESVNENVFIRFTK